MPKLAPGLITMVAAGAIEIEVYEELRVILSTDRTVLLRGVGSEGEKDIRQSN